jgi:hypothetical protein
MGCANPGQRHHRGLAYITPCPLELSPEVSISSIFLALTSGYQKEQNVI